jgi:hypothetical protein
MKTLQEDIDDLDRMVDTGAQKDAIRSQIRLIAREVAAFQADYDSLAASHAKLGDEKAAVDKQLADMKARDEKSTDDFFAQKAEEERRIIQSHLLKH